MRLPLTVAATSNSHGHTPGPLRLDDYNHVGCTVLYVRATPLGKVTPLTSAPVAYHDMTYSSTYNIIYDYKTAISFLLSSGSRLYLAQQPLWGHLCVAALTFHHVPLHQPAVSSRLRTTHQGRLHGKQQSTALIAPRPRRVSCPEAAQAGLAAVGITRSQ